MKNDIKYVNAINYIIGIGERAPTSTQLRPPPSSSIHLQPAPPAPPSSLQHHRRYKNQNIARN